MRTDERNVGEGLRTYSLLSRLPFPKSYAGKLFLAAFIGTHVPLIALAAFLLSSDVDERVRRKALAVALPATVVGAASTVWALHALLAPVSRASEALRSYLDRGELPDLPTSYADRAGRLMRDVSHAVGRLDGNVRSLEELSSRDPLTGLHNRRAAEVRLEEDVARARRGGGAFALAVLDLDQLKGVNDALGHQAGDACLRRAAEAISANMRAGDWAARWGGDEFVAVLWEAGGAPAAGAFFGRVGEDLRRGPARLPQGGEVRLTLSGGACRYAGEGSAGELFAGADAALLRAKREGGGGMLECE